MQLYVLIRQHLLAIVLESFIFFYNILEYAEHKQLLAKYLPY